MNVENAGRVLISILAIAIYAAYVCALIFVPIPTEMKDVINTAGGTLSGAFGLAIGYWIGSSASSSSKDKTITTLSNKGT